MAAHIGHTSRSRRFIKVYLAAWALLAVGALGYLGMLAFPLQGGTSPLQVIVGPIRSGTGDSKALTEVREMRGSLTEIRKDVTQLQEAMSEREANDRVVETRLTALEESVSSADDPQGGAATGTPENVEADDAQGSTAPDKAAHQVSEHRRTADAGSKPDAPSSPSVVPPPGVVIETGSIASVAKTAPKVAPKEEIVFGEPVVTPASQSPFAVQLAAATSAQALRQSWGQLAGRHSDALASLQPRVVAPRSEGGFYRLLAGPVPTKAEAERICSQLGVGPKACFATPYTGSPL
jgi:hypothetical protein